MAKTTKPVTAIIAALFPKSEKALSEALGTEQFNAFAEDAQEVQDRLDAQAEGNQAVANDLATANATLKETQDKLTASETALEKANGDLTAANKLATEAQAKAGQWDAYQASLKGTNMGSDTSNGKEKPAPVSTMSDKDQKILEDKNRLAAKYPGLMAGLHTVADEE
ncbi:hypothetical protein FAES_2285 [Fibrella aestuarina BUZ 2]|uniref:Uncharacterized protein n=1 Tax=Fibrella aestuarina BUZ 2 TaxID=1166018 RepID=I0K841_9BACT|nr:hypothetical protein [Fibrella aestuarina]CCH00294.1 hypothetical protein FAES_2285 [Fibrella aestuarina BUZ 2]